MAWTEERVESLKSLWADGLSACQIAGRIGGVTRNAVIGKVHRLGLAGRNTAIRMKAGRKRKGPKPNTRRPYRLKPRKVEGEFSIPVEPISTPQENDIPRVVFALTSDSQCRFIPGDPKHDSQANCCGDVTVPGTPYCAGHLARCCTPVMPSKHTRPAYVGGKDYYAHKHRFTEDNAYA